MYAESIVSEKSFFTTKYFWSYHSNSLKQQNAQI